MPSAEIVDQCCKLESHSGMYRQTTQVEWGWCDQIASMQSSDEVSEGVLYPLPLVHVGLRHACKQCIAVVKSCADYRRRLQYSSTELHGYDAILGCGSKMLDRF